MRTRILAGVFLLGLGCGPSSDAASPTDSAAQGSGRSKNRPRPVAPDSTKVTAFTVDADNLKVDRISMRDGGTRPDGNRDLVFDATVEGPCDALFLAASDEKGNPQYGFRADTVAGAEELPSELGSVVDVGRLTIWIAVVENGKFINQDGGKLSPLAAGPHSLKLYVPNPGNLDAGAHVRLYARALNGGLAASPVITY
jgi:hypothetical protein